MVKFIIKNLNEGYRSEDLKVIGETDQTGTTTHFKPDREIFTETTEL